MARTRIRNVSSSTLSLPLPYSGVLVPGDSTTVAETTTEVIEALGGTDVIRFLFDVAEVPESSPLGPFTRATAAANVADALIDLTGPLDLNGQRIINLGAPVDGSDAATKAYVDTHGGGGGGGVATVTATAPITVSGTATDPVIGISQAGLALGANQITTGTLVAARGGTGLGAPGAGDAGKVLTATSGGTYQLSTPSTVTLTRELFVAGNGNDSTGDGSLSKPYLTIGAALTAAGPADGTYVRINVAPGNYSGDLTITRQRTAIVGASASPDQKATQIAGTVTVNCGTASSKFVDTVELFGLYIEATDGDPALKLTGTSLYGVSVEACYLTANNTAANVVLVDADNVGRPRLIIRDSVVTQQAINTTAPVMQFTRGDVRIDATQIYASVPGTAAMVVLENNATLLGERVLADSSMSGPAISVNSSATEIPLLLSNSSVTARGGGTSADAINVAISTPIPAAYLWQTILVASDAVAKVIDGTASVYFGALTFGPNSSGVINSSIGGGVTLLPLTERLGTVAVGGDLSGSLPSPTVAALRGTPVQNVAPLNGQVLTYDGAAWVPGAAPNGGSGGGDLTYFLNYGTAAGAPTTNLPGTPKQLASTAEASPSSVTSATLSTSSYDLVAGFVTDATFPGVLAIPTGLWDINLWASSNATLANQVLLQLKVYTYDGSNAPTLIATSGDLSVYDPTAVTQYSLSMLVPQTTILVTDRVYVEVLAKATTGGLTVTLEFGNGSPSHVHTTLPSISGTGRPKIINGVVQPTASAINLAGGSSEITGTLPAGNGGTGITSPGTTGNVLTSDGTGWTSAAPTVPDLPVSPAATYTYPASITVDAKGRVTSASNGSIPYDLAGEVVGALTTGSEIFHFIAARAFTLNSTASAHKFECVTASTGTVTITLAKFSGVTAVNLLVATYSAGNTTASVAQAGGVGPGDFAISAGDKLVLTISLGGGETFSVPYFSLFGVVA